TRVGRGRSKWRGSVPARQTCESVRRETPSYNRLPTPATPITPVVDLLQVGDPVLEDVLAAALDVVTHQHPEHLLRVHRVREAHLGERPLRRVERRLPQLLGVHFTEAFEAGDGQALFAERADLGDEAAEVIQLTADLVVSQH